MKISIPQQKKLLAECFLEQGPQGFKEVTFPLEKLAAAGLAKTKLMDSIDDDNKYTDEMIEFSPAEVVILKELWDKKKKLGFGASSAEFVLGLEDIFNGKKLK